MATRNTVLVWLWKCRKTRQHCPCKPTVLMIYLLLKSGPWPEANCHKNLESKGVDIALTSSVPWLPMSSPGLKELRSSAFDSPHATNAAVSKFRRSTLKSLSHEVAALVSMNPPTTTAQNSVTAAGSATPRAPSMFPPIAPFIDTRASICKQCGFVRARLCIEHASWLR